MPNSDNVVMEEVRIIFRNFAGKEGQYNREGDRNFNVILDTEVAEAMAKDGWNIKWLKPREEDEDQLAQAIIEVKISYKGRPPRIVMVTSRGRTSLSEGEVELLDWADIRNVDLIIRPYEWAVNGKTGIKAYLQSMFVTIEEDALEIKYADIGDVQARGGRTEG